MLSRPTPATFTSLRLPVAFAIAWAASGCGPVAPIDTDPTITTLPPPTTPPGPTYDEQANLVLIARHAEVDNLSDEVLMYGVAAASIRDFANLAVCIAEREETYCVDALPTEFDTWVDVKPWDELLLDLLETTDIGPSVALGPYTATRVVPAEGLTAYRNNNLAGFGPPQDGELDLSFSDGEWGDYEALDVAPVPDPMILNEPDPTRGITLTDGFFPLRWTPGLVGQVYLAVESETVHKLFLLEDDGSHDLDVDALGLTDLEEVKVTISRWTHTVHEQDGNDIEILIQDEQILRGTYRDLTGRTEIFGAETCAEARYANELASGFYFGRLNAATNDVVPSGPCGNAGAGPETILRTQLNPGGELNVTYAIFNADAALYLMTECGDMGTCLAQSNVIGNSQIEQLSYTSDLPGPSDVFVVLDSRTGPINDLFLLDVDRINIYGNTLVDSCAEALYQPSLTSVPAGTERYVGNISTYHNYADPAGGCGLAGISAPGQEGMVRVEVASGETITATVDMPGADPVLYFLYNCANSLSCPIGSDVGTGSDETVTYTNTTPVNEVLYLIVDSHGGTAGYTLDLLIE